MRGDQIEVVNCHFAQSWVKKRIKPGNPIKVYRLHESIRRKVVSMTIDSGHHSVAWYGSATFQVFQIGNMFCHSGNIVDSK